MPRRRERPATAFRPASTSGAPSSARSSSESSPRSCSAATSTSRARPIRSVRAGSSTPAPYRPATMRWSRSARRSRYGSTNSRRAARLRLRSRPLLFRGQLGRRHGLETLVRDRLPALDRKAVGPGGDALLGPLHGRELLPQILRPARVELVLVEIRRQVRGVVLVCRLAVVPTPQPGERPLDAFSFGGQQLAFPLVIHRVTGARSGRSSCRLRAEAEGRVLVGHQDERVADHTIRPPEDAENEVEDSAWVPAREEDRE